jgi:hypothetical protein
VPLIGYWEDIDDFLVNETKRLLSLYLAAPKYMGVLKGNEPNNVTPEILERLYKEGKLKPKHAK